jgi:CO/xanthine dehydrogenase FAD-binding subunit
MAEGGFFKATSPQEAVSLLAEHGSTARLLAGGSDLMVAVNRQAFKPEVLIYLGDSGLGGISENGNDLVIGAAATFADILASDLVKQKAPLLIAAAQEIASVAIRNVGTIGGNLANASPAADSAPPLLALGARLKLASAGGEREVRLAEFFTGPGQTVLAEGEMITEIIVPAQPEDGKWAYRKMGKRKAQSLSVVSVAINLPGGGGAAIALGAVAPTPLLVQDAAAILEEKPLDDDTIAQVAKACAAATKPIDDMRGTAWYRTRATGAVVKQLLDSLAS